MRQLWVFLVVALAGCDGKPMQSSGGGSAGGGGVAGFAGPGPAPDWSAKKLVPQEGTIDDIAFTIDVPEGLPRDKRNGGDWDDPDSRYDQAPKIFTSTIEISRIQSLKEAKYHGTLDAAAKTWVREQSNPDSWALTMAEPDKSRIEVILYKQANDSLFIRCKATQAAVSGPLPNHAKTMKLLESICDSLKVKGPVEKPRDPDPKAEDILDGQDDKVPSP